MQQLVVTIFKIKMRTELSLKYKQSSEIDIFSKLPKVYN